MNEIEEAKNTLLDLFKTIETAIKNYRDQLKLKGMESKFIVGQEVWVKKQISHWATRLGFNIPNDTKVEDAFEKLEIKELTIKRVHYDTHFTYTYTVSRYYQLQTNLDEDEMVSSKEEAIAKWSTDFQEMKAQIKSETKQTELDEVKKAHETLEKYK